MKPESLPKGGGGLGERVEVIALGGFAYGLSGHKTRSLVHKKERDEPSRAGRRGSNRPISLARPADKGLGDSLADPKWRSKTK
jgi:hypothetical protein